VDDDDDDDDDNASLGSKPKPERGTPVWGPSVLHVETASTWRHFLISQGVFDNLYSPVSIRTGSIEILTNLTK